jgi:SAM-dependent methyltransferase
VQQNRAFPSPPQRLPFGIVSSNGKPRGARSLVTVSSYLEARQGGDQDTERRFLAQLRLRNGVAKVTYPSRLDDTAQLLLSYARQLHRAPVRVLDVGCSSGVSTIELHRALREGGVPAETVGTDAALRGVFVSRGADGILFDTNLAVLQAESSGWVTPWYWWKFRESRSPVLAHALTSLRLWARAHAFRSATSKKADGYSVQVVPFTCRLVDDEADVTILEEDLAAPQVEGPFDIVRAANILNRVYFSDLEIRQLVRRLVRRIREGGLFLVARSHEVNGASLFVLRDGRLSEVASLNGGSDIRDLVVSARETARS